MRPPASGESAPSVKSNVRSIGIPVKTPDRDAAHRATDVGWRGSLAHGRPSPARRGRAYVRQAARERDPEGPATTAPLRGTMLGHRIATGTATPRGSGVCTEAHPTRLRYSARTGAC